MKEFQEKQEKKRRRTKKCLECGSDPVWRSYSIALSEECVSEQTVGNGTKKTSVPENTKLKESQNKRKNSVRIWWWNCVEEL